jgi:hypothetical protein
MQQPPKQPAKPAVARRPRDAAGSMELQGGTGPIKHMISFGDFMEAYKSEKTFKVRTPNSVDPSNTDPNAPWIVQATAQVGCAHPIVARVVVQSYAFLSEVMVTRPVDVDATMRLLHLAKENLLALEAAVVKLQRSVHAVVEGVDAKGLEWTQDARAINPFPHVQELDAMCADVLVKANRQVRTLCELAGCFVDLEKKHSNFDHLHKGLVAKVGADVPLSEMVADNSAFVRRIVELRNFDEHRADQQTVIHNFELGAAPDYNLLMPSWEVQGTPGQPREDICQDSHDMLAGLLELTEWMVIHGMMHWRNTHFDQFVEELAQEHVDPECPVSYRPRLDPSSLLKSRSMGPRS